MCTYHWTTVYVYVCVCVCMITVLDHHDSGKAACRHVRMQSGTYVDNQSAPLALLQVLLPCVGRAGQVPGGAGNGAP